MIRNGKFAIDNGKEYRCINRGKEKIVLISYESSDIDNGFERSNYLFNKYIKEMSIKDVEELYTVSTMAEYREDVFIAIEEDNEKLLLKSSARSYDLKSIGFVEIDRGDFQKWVDKKYINRTWEEIQKE